MKRKAMIRRVKDMLHTVALVDEMVTLYQNTVGIHTFELQWCMGNALSGQETLRRIWDVIKNGKLQQKRQRWLMNGLWAEIVQVHRNGYSDMIVLKMVVNPKVMVDGEKGYLEISEKQTLMDAFRMFDGFWKKQGLEIRMNDCWLTRVDVCMNLQMHPAFRIPEYLDLLNRTPHELRYSLKGEKNSPPNLYSVSWGNASRSLCIYDKAYEQGRFSEERSALCPNLMRIELRLYSDGVKKVVKKFPAVSTKEAVLRMVDLAPMLLSEGLCMCLPSEPYVRMPELLAVIDQHTELHEKSRQDMRELATSLAMCNIYEELADTADRSRLRSLNRKFIGIGISPACIRGDHQPNFLPSLPTMVIKVLKDAGQLF